MKGDVIMLSFFKNICCTILIIIFITSTIISGTLAWDSINQDSIGLASGESNIFIDVELLLQEKVLENEEQKIIPGTIFYLFKESGEQIGEQYITNDDGKIPVSLNKGNYYFELITPTIGYTYDEINGEKITRYPFEINGKEEETVIVNAYNIRLNGSLLISKVIKNIDDSILNEEQLNTEFEFNVAFSDDGEYTYRIDNEEQQILKSGDIIKLKHGQTVVFDSIPVGVLYNVTETKVDGYISSSSNHHGNITETGSNVVFTNIYDPNFLPSDEKIKLLVTKKLEGEYLEIEEQKEFNFSLLVDGEETKFTLKKDETKEFEISVGSNYEIKEDDYFKDEYSQKITNGFGTAYKNDIEVVATNTYIGEVKTIIFGEKTWIIDNNINISLPEYITVKIKNGDLVVQEIEVRENSDGRWIYEFIVSKYDSNGNEINYIIEEDVVNGFIATYNGYNITNTYISPIKVELPTVYKEIYGVDYPKTKFEFMLKGKNMPMPDNSEEDVKIVTLEDKGEIGFGTITFENPGIYTYTISELNGGIEGWTYDDKVYTITITITEKNGILGSEINWDGRTKENPDILFTNSYHESILGKNTIISGTINWEHGNNPNNKQPTSVIISVYGDGELVVQRQITNKDNWKFSFELPKYDEFGNKINYTIGQDDIKNYQKSINGYDIYNKFIGTSTSDNPQTGDNIIKYFISLIISGIILFILLITRLKKIKVLVL